MHFSTFVHRAVRIALLSVSALLLLTIATLLYAKHVTAIDILMPIVEDSIINAMTFIFCGIVETVSFATALAYRSPVHRLRNTSKQPLVPFGDCAEEHVFERIHHSV